MTAVGLTALCTLHFLIAFDRVGRKTPTLDEVAHVPAGLSYVEMRTFKMYRFSPPLARLLSGLAAKSAEPVTDYGGTWQNHQPANHWLFAFRFLLFNAENRDRYLKAFTRARLVTAAWSALTIPFLFLWSAWWLGRPAGWLAAVLWTLSPNILAHAALATTDVPAASFGLIASYLFARWLDRPGWRRATLAGAALGLAQLVKFSSLWLLIFWPIWALAHVVSRQEGSFPWRQRFSSVGARPWRLATAPAGKQFLAVGLVGLVVINAGYLFEGTGRPVGDFPFVCDMLTRPRSAADGRPQQGKELGSSRAYNDVLHKRVNQFRGTLLGRFPCPLPEHYVAGFDEQKFEADGGSKAFLKPTEGRGYQVYLRGELRRRGWWYYYFYALAIKVPLSTWLLIGLAAVGAWRWPVTPHRPLVVWSLFVIGPLLAMSLLTDINIGVRYTLAVFPFLFLIAGSVWQAARPAWWKSLGAMLIGWNAWALYSIHPHELSYFNELIGGPANGRYHLIDSNLDWGQDLRGLARWLENHPEWRDVRIAYMGSVPPEFEGIDDYRLAPRDARVVPDTLRWPGEDVADPNSFGPQPGKYAVSVNLERGMAFHTPCPNARVNQVLQLRPRAFRPAPPMLYNPADAYRYFQELTPRIEFAIGYSILLYDVSLEDANRVRATIGLPPLQ